MNKRTALLLAACLAAPSLLHAGPRSFCSMDQAVDQMEQAGGIDKEGIYKDLRGAVPMQQISSIVRDIASDLVTAKLAESGAQTVQITWKDIYDLRGTVSSWVCDQGARMYCAASFIDAMGSGLTGTAVGRGLTGAGLALAGPPGFVLLGGMKIAQETFQCTPDTVAMALDAGETVVVLLPWCKAPGLNKLCVRAGKAAGGKALELIARYGNQEYAIGAAKFVQTQAGGKLVKVVVEEIANSAKEQAAGTANSAIYSSISKSAGDTAPAPGAPLPVAVPDPF